mmetsp:Transcript_86153/g.278326  ORF Transcript_86153/g.278326 Transcript_86153/m.278326 type:complete len:894 (+) Transcript_86153:137-2818(+)
MAFGPRVPPHVARCPQPRLSSVARRAASGVGPAGLTQAEPMSRHAFGSPRSAEDEAVELRIRDLDFRLEKHASNEEHLLDVLEELRHALEGCREENMTGVDVAVQEMDKLHGSLQGADRSADILRERVRQLDGEAAHLQRQLADVDAECGVIARAREEHHLGVLTRETAVLHDSCALEGTQRALEQQVRDAAVLDTVARDAQSRNGRLARYVTSLRAQLRFADEFECDRRGTLQARLSMTLLARTFATFVGPIRAARRTRALVGKCTSRQRLRSLRGAFSTWREAVKRQVVVRIIEQRRCVRRQRFVFKAWLASQQATAGSPPLATWGGLAEPVQPSPESLPYSAKAALLGLAFVSWCLFCFCMPGSTSTARGACAALMGRRWGYRKVEVFILRSIARCWLARWRLVAGGRLMSRWRARDFRRGRLGRHAFGCLGTLARRARCVKLMLQFRRHRYRRVLSRLLYWWRFCTAECRRLEEIPEILRRKWHPRQRRSLLQFGFSGFKLLVEWLHKAACFKRHLVEKQQESLVGGVFGERGVFWHWRAAVRRTRGTERLARACEIGARRVLRAWRAVLHEVGGLLGMVNRLEFICSGRHARHVLMAWLRLCRRRRELESRGATVSQRRRLSLCRCLLDAWRLELRLPLRRRRGELLERLRDTRHALGLSVDLAAAAADDVACLLEGGLVDSGGGLCPGERLSDVDWFLVVDRLHAAVGDAAACSTELRDAQDQSGSLVKAVQTERWTCDALQAELLEFRASARKNSLLVGARANSLQEELSGMFDDQAHFRDALRRCLEDEQNDRRAAAEARERCIELENCLEDSRRICTGSAEERRRQIVALEAYTKKRQGELESLKDALEDALAEQAELADFSSGLRDRDAAAAEEEERLQGRFY